jgi:hypothetical protein
MADNRRKEKRRKKKTSGAHRGQNGHFTRRFDNVNSEYGQNGTQVNKS